MQAGVTVLANLHREGHLAYPALRSAVLAAQQAIQKGVLCRIIAVIDCGDDITREQVYQFRGQLDAVCEVDYGDVASARNHGIERIDTKYMATLDGDDLFDLDWLWKSVSFLEALGDDNSVGHTQVRLTFGNERGGRLHISTDSHLFNPLNLISSWHYAADVIVPTNIYKKHPFKPCDPYHGLSAEDWYWTCESIVEGIRHVIIPETTYFYRRQANHMSLGTLPGCTYHPTRLLDRSTIQTLTGTHPSASILLADKVHSVTGPKERWPRVPRWLEQSIRRACDIDLEVFELHSRLSSVSFETPDFFPAVGQLYLQLMDQVDDSCKMVVVFCDLLTSGYLGLIDGFLAANRLKGSPPLTVLIVTLAQDRDCDGKVRSLNPFKAGDDQHRDTSWLRLRCVDLGNRSTFSNLWEHLQQNLIVRFLMQARPALAVNLDSEFFDRLIGSFGKPVAKCGTRTVRICQGGEADICDDDTFASWQALTLAQGNYSLALCRNAQVAAWLNTCFYGTRMAFHFCIEAFEGGPDRAFGDALHALIRFHDQVSGSCGQGNAAATIMDIPALRCSAPAPASKPDVTCVLTVRSEGHYLNQMLQAVAAMFGDAGRHDINTEMVIVADCPGERTRNVLSSLLHSWPEARVIETELGDEASARNIGIAAASGRLVAVLTGTDIVSPGWLARAVRRIEEQGPNTIIHPHAVVEFADCFKLSYQPDMDDSGNSIEGLAAQEVWTIHALAYRELFLRIPYRPMPAQSGYGQSAWHWNCETVMAGCRHLTVGETAIYRRPPEFIGEREVRLGRNPPTTLPPTRFFTDHPWLRQRASRRKARKAWWRMILRAAWKRLASLAGKHDGQAIEAVPVAWNDAAYLLANPDVRKVVADGGFRSGYHHYCLHGFVEGRAPHYETSHLIEEMRALSIINPVLKTASSGGAALRTTASSQVSDAYRSCWEIVSPVRPTHIFLTSSLRPGGAELSMIYTLEAVLSSPSNHALVITTADSDERWRHRLPARCTWLPFGALTVKCPIEERSGILTRLLINSGARCLHLFYSDLGWQVLRLYAPALADRLQVYVSVFCIPPVNIAQGSGYARFVGALCPHLAGIFTDNKRAATALQTVCGIPHRKITIVKHPAIAEPRFSSPSPGKNLVLWASRLDHDKRPGLLTEIAKRLPYVSFHAYGENVLDDKKHLEHLQRVPNIVYRGSFCGFDSIATAPYMCFLYTSLWDGLPNVVLEAMKSGLLVVAPDVGGIAEIVGDDSGVLVRDPNGPGAFADAIERVFRDPEVYRPAAENGSRRVTKAHTRTAFLEGLKNVPGYL
jgi:glycosyltransferase involved in cell wall biosynthesis